MTQPLSDPPVYVWDPFVRVFHWSLVACVLLNFVVEEGETLHQAIGYAASALVVLRVLWGFIGTRHARFADFFPTPERVRRHVSGLLAGTAPHYVGHNPLGALMMLSLMALVLALGLTGYLQTTDSFWGEEWLEGAARRPRLHPALAGRIARRRGRRPRPPRTHQPGRRDDHRHQDAPQTLSGGPASAQNPDPARSHPMKSLLHLFIVGGLACAASLAVAGERPRVEEVRQLRDAGKILPAEEILVRSRKVQPGQVVGLKLEREGGRLIYEVKLIDNANRFHQLEFDAATGALLRHWGK